MTIDEAILLERETVRRNKMMLELNKLMQESHAVCFDKLKRETSIRIHEQLAEWLEELKTIKEMDLSIPQNFTKEQSDWIKSYCIKRNIEFYNKALDDFVKFASDMPTVEAEYGEIRPMRLEEMAEQLKAGANNGT